MFIQWDCEWTEVVILVAGSQGEAFLVLDADRAMQARAEQTLQDKPGRAYSKADLNLTRQGLSFINVPFFFSLSFFPFFLFVFKYV